MLEKIRREPVLLYGFVVAVLDLAVAFGLDLSKGQTGAILGLTTALLAFVARKRTTPLDKRGHLI